MAKCFKCGETDLSKIGSNRSRKDGKAAYCHVCTREQYHTKFREASLAQNKEWHKANIQRANETNWKRQIKHLGADPELYYKLFQQQNSVCFICRKDNGTTKYGVKRKLSIDHCHKTQRIRGLLCNKCNSWLGRIEDDIKAARRVLAYLQRRKINA